MPERLCCPVDAYMLLERRGRLLILRRARETAEETGIQLQPSQMQCAVVIHHRSPSGQARLGWFFTACPGWVGDPVNREPSKHTGLVWVDPDALPGDMVAYTWAGLRAWRSGAQFAVHWQEPGSPVHYDPRHEHELTLLPSCPPAVHPRREESAR